MNRLGVLALVALGCGGSAELPGPSAGTRTVEVTRGDLADRVLLTGALRAGSTIDVSVPKTDAWQLTIRWMAEDGVLVKAGERVLEFDNSMFTSGLEQKRIAATEARTTYQSLREVSALAIAVKEHELEQHRIALAKATLLASVPADLLPQRTAQERLLEQARAETAVARAEKELAAEKQAAALEQQVKQIELAKATRTVEAAERSIAELVLTAPRDGVLMIGDHPWEGRTYRVGDTVQPGMRLLSMPEAGVPMIVHAELSDVDDGRIATGMTGTCTLDAYPREPLSCTVTELAPVAGTRDPGSLRRAFAVTLTLATTDQDRMRPGMSVKVELVGPGPRAALLAPRGAVVFVDSPLLRLAGGARRPVKLGPCDAQRCVIEDGAAEGDAVEVGAR